MRICLFDPAIENHENHPSSNLGDLIIGAAVERELRHLFPDANVLRLSTQAPLKWNHLLKMLTCPVRIVGGTNLLSSFMDRYKRPARGEADQQGHFARSRLVAVPESAE
jgi:hypothetical protein